MADDRISGSQLLKLIPYSEVDLEMHIENTATLESRFIQISFKREKDRTVNLFRIKKKLNSRGTLIEQIINLKNNKSKMNLVLAKGKIRKRMGKNSYNFLSYDIDPGILNLSTLINEEFFKSDKPCLPKSCIRYTNGAENVSFDIDTGNNEILSVKFNYEGGKEVLIRFKQYKECEGVLIPFWSEIKNNQSPGTLVSSIIECSS